MTRSPSRSLNSFCTGSPYPVDAGTSMMRDVYAAPKFEKNTTRGARAARQHGQHRVALAQPRRREIAHFLLPLHPSVARHDHDVVLFDDEVVLRERTSSSDSINVRRLSFLA